MHYYLRKLLLEIFCTDGIDLKPSDVYFLILNGKTSVLHKCIVCLRFFKFGKKFLRDHWKIFIATHIQKYVTNLVTCSLVKKKKKKKKKKLKPFLKIDFF